MEAELAGHAAEAAGHGIDLVQVVALLAAGVVAVPLFRRLGLGSVLGYLTAGILVGPWGPLRLIDDPEAILHTAELGVVLFLFVVGLEMEPRKLWGMRRQIFGLGALQVLLCGGLLSLVGMVLGLPPALAFVAGMGFVLTSTAIVMQLLQERGELASTGGQKIVSILLLEDLAIVPLLAVVALLAPAHDEGGDLWSRWIAIAVAAASVVTVIFAGRYVLNPVFRLLADSKAREVMTAAALLVVLGAALIMQTGGLSMAMGAFLAGVLLSTSMFRHQLEADVEPFRGILLGLFFLAVGMSLDLLVVMENWGMIAISVAAYMAIKGAAIYAVARFFRSGHSEAMERAVLMAQGGEFAFVLYTTAASVGLIGPGQNAVMTATVIVSMVLTPFAVLALRRVLPAPEQSMEGIEVADGLTGNVLVIGFGRFGQIASQVLLSRGVKITIIDNNTEMIRAAQTFGFKIYYGDGTRLDILRAAGAPTADAVLVAIDKREQTTRIVELMRSEFPLVKLLARTFDRAHAIELVKLGVDYQLREVFESALAFGAETIRQLGASEEEVEGIVEAVRMRDGQRFEAQVLGGLQAGRDLLISNAEQQARESGVVKRPSTPIIAPPEEERAKA
jgi:glutathione-regulated potassium-efflux system protein KefB